MDMEDNRPLFLPRDVLKCHACHGNLQPPIYTCEALHSLCASCRGAHGTLCKHSVAHNRSLDIIAYAATTPCHYRRFGCIADVPFNEDADHRRACPHAPCGCPERGCHFFGSRKNLLAHVADSCDGHARHIISFRYGQQEPLKLNLPLSVPWYILVGQDQAASGNSADRLGDIFLVSLGERSGTTLVSVVCVRADGGALGLPQFSCAIAVEYPRCGTTFTMQVPKLTSSSLSVDDLSGAAQAPTPGFPVLNDYLSGDVVKLSLEIKKLEADPSPPQGQGAHIPPPPPQDSAGKNRKRKSTTPRKLSPRSSCHEG